jgi:hypothetical protein
MDRGLHLCLNRGGLAARVALYDDAATEALKK